MAESIVSVARADDRGEGNIQCDRAAPAIAIATAYSKGAMAAVAGHRFLAERLSARQLAGGVAVIACVLVTMLS